MIGAVDFKIITVYWYRVCTKYEHNIASDFEIYNGVKCIQLQLHTHVKEEVHVKYLVSTYYSTN